MESVQQPKTKLLERKYLYEFNKKLKSKFIEKENILPLFKSQITTTRRFHRQNIANVWIFLGNQTLS